MQQRIIYEGVCTTNDAVAFLSVLLVMQKVQQGG